MADGEAVSYTHLDVYKRQYALWIKTTDNTQNSGPNTQKENFQLQRR